MKKKKMIPAPHPYTEYLVSAPFFNKKEGRYYVGLYPANKENGLIVPPKDVDALSNQIIKLIEDRVFRDQIGLAGKSRIETDFNLESMCQKYEKLIYTYINQLIS